MSKIDIMWDKGYGTKAEKPLLLYVTFFVDAGVQTGDVQNAKRLGLKTICSRLDKMWRKWDKTVKGNTFF